MLRWRQPIPADQTLKDSFLFVLLSYDQATSCAFGDFIFNNEFGNLRAQSRRNLLISFD